MRLTERGGMRALVTGLSGPASRALLALVAVVLLGGIFHADGAFWEWHTHRDMLRQVSVYGILACGMTLVIITAGIDLSVGSVLGLPYRCASWLAPDAVFSLDR
jgi:ribose/xylose/arabinose/galactoside ABC-type transport system permease subunit